MPIEIRELVIRARVDPSAGFEPDESSELAPVGQESNHENREDLVQTCVKEVLRILEDKQER